jgi:hypothetical protein
LLDRKLGSYYLAQFLGNVGVAGFQASANCTPSAPLQRLSSILFVGTWFCLSIIVTNLLMHLYLCERARLVSLASVERRDAHGLRKLELLFMQEVKVLVCVWVLGCFGLIFWTLTSWGIVYGYVASSVVGAASLACNVIFLVRCTSFFLRPIMELLKLGLPQKTEILLRVRYETLAGATIAVGSSIFFCK